MIAEIVARLEAEAAPPLKGVKGAGEAAALTGAPQRHRLPEAYVVPLRHAAQPGTAGTGRHTQRVAARYGVLIGVPAAGERHAGDASADVEAVYDAVRAALAGWTPAGAPAPFELAAGAVNAIGGGVLWWLEEYVIDEYLIVQ